MRGRAARRVCLSLAILHVGWCLLLPSSYQCAASLSHQLPETGTPAGKEPAAGRMLPWMGQSFNAQAVRTLGSVVRHPSLAIPHIALGTISQLDFAKLKALGIKGIIFDKDNTLTAPYVDELHPAVAAGFQRCATHFAGSMCIMSNSAGTGDDVGFASANRIESRLDIPVLRHMEKKPGGLAEVLAFFRDKCGDEAIGAGDLCVIGDRLLTDVVFGNLHGMLTVHTKPLTLEGDNRVAMVARFLESRLFFNVVQAGFAVGSPEHRLSASLDSLVLPQEEEQEHDGDAHDGNASLGSGSSGDEAQRNGDAPQCTQKS